jgi:hypothetical protein
MAAASHWDVESGKLLYPSKFGHIATSIYQAAENAVHDSGKKMSTKNWSSGWTSSFVWSLVKALLNF